MQDLTVEDRVSRTEYQYSVEDVNAQELGVWTPRLLEKLQSLPQLRDVATDRQDLGLQASLVIDRDTASRLGILPATIDNILYDAFGQRQVSTMFTQLNQYHVILEVDPRFQKNPDSLKDIYVPSSTSNTVAVSSVPQSSATSTAVIPSTNQQANSAPSANPNLVPNSIGGEVPLSAFTHYEPGTGSLVINHQGQFPVVTLSFNLAPNVSLGDAVNAINSAAASLGMPASIQTSFQGTAQAFLNSLSNEPILILAALITVYIVLGVLYESYIHPITILSTLPSAGVGAILGPAFVPHGIQRHRAHRTHPAHWNCEKERHHDDRLRARS